MSTEFDSPTSTSPSPSLAPTPTSATFSSNRSVSGVSSVSSHSTTSNGSSGTKSTGATASRRRGYVRPQGIQFAPSAQNRESVMSLGSIAHLQYYFARTGLLDGKGGRLAKTKENGAYDIPKYSKFGTNHLDESEIAEEGQLLWEAMQEEGEDVMLPPTVSTYSHRSQYVPPPPDQKQLKRDLVEALENTLQSLEVCEKIAGDPNEESTQGFYELQGLQILDTTTLAIRAARLYYTLHPNPKRLNSIKSDQQIRKDLFTVLEVLKKCAARNFAGGFREDESLAVLVWVSEVGMMIDQEARLEEADKNERKDWLWMENSNWINDQRGRELDFLRFLLREAKPNLNQEEILSESQFFTNLADGRDLIKMHNAAVKKSKKPFGQIEKIHDDVAKPYRRADNLRFWLKASELRWEKKLKLDVLAVANAIQIKSSTTSPATSPVVGTFDDKLKNNNHPIWFTFEETIRSWSNIVRTELTKDWNGEEERKLHARAKSLAMASPLGSPSKAVKSRPPPLPTTNITNSTITRSPKTSISRNVTE